MLYKTSNTPMALTEKRKTSYKALCAIFALSLAGCGETLPVCPDVSSALPNPPALSTSQPAQPYSLTWQQKSESSLKLVQESRQKLMSTRLMKD